MTRQRKMGKLRMAAGAVLAAMIGCGWAAGQETQPEQADTDPGQEVPEVTKLPSESDPGPPTDPAANVPPADPPADPASPPPDQPTTILQPPELSPELGIDRRFTSAQTALSENRLADSASDLLHAAALAEALGDPTDEALSEAIATLRVLAFDTASHEVKDPTRFNRAFAALHHALAAQNFRTASGAWKERRDLTAARDLQRSVYHLRRSIDWGGRAVSDEGEATLTAAATAASELQTEERVISARVSEAMAKFGEMVPAVGQKLAEDRAAAGVDTRVVEASRKAIHGIREGTRKAAEKIGETLSDFGRRLQGER